MSPGALDELRALVPAADEVLYFDIGGHSLKFAPVVEATVGWLRFSAAGPGRPDIGEATAAMIEGVRERVARALGADADEIMLGENTTIGINQVANGLEWQAGDNVVLSSHAHPGNRIPWYNLAGRRGIELRFVQVTPDRRRLLAEVEAAIDARTRLVSMSHVSRRTGQRLPAQAIVGIAHARGVPVLLDGAQSFGAVPVDVRALDCDFYTVGGHKYIMAPQGTGAFYIRRDRLEFLRPSFIGSRSQSWMDDAGRMTLHDSARRFEYGTRNTADVAGFGRALDIWESFGWPNVYAQIATVTSRLKERLAAIPGVTVDTPWPYEESSAIVTFRLAAVEATALTDWLWREERILASPVEGDGPDGRAIRITGHAITLDAEADRLADAVDRFRRSAAAGAAIASSTGLASPGTGG